MSSVTRPAEVSLPVLERYQRHLYYYRKADGQPLSARRQLTVIVHIKGFFRWLARSNRLTRSCAGAGSDGP